MINEQIIYWFELLIRQIRYDLDNKKGKEKLQYSYKLQSIQKALKQIKKYKKKIKNGSDLSELSGIGKGTIQRIDEILSTGNLAEVNQAIVSGKYLQYIEELENIFGIGRAVAIDLYTNHSIRSIAELKYAVDNNLIELPENIRKGLKWYDQMDMKIPRSELDNHYIELLKYSLKIDPEMNCIVCGSYRRGERIMSDIDVIISHPNIITIEESRKSDLLERFINYLIKQGYVLDNLTSTDVRTKFMGICRSYKKDRVRRIDIRFIPMESYYTALLYFTGSKDFNRNIRAIAKDMGYILNEYHLLDNHMNPYKIGSEREIFEILGMEYLRPDQR